MVKCLTFSMWHVFNVPFWIKCGFMKICDSVLFLFTFYSSLQHFFGTGGSNHKNKSHRVNDSKLYTEYMQQFYLLQKQVLLVYFQNSAHIQYWEQIGTADQYCLQKWWEHFSQQPQYCRAFLPIHNFSPLFFEVGFRCINTKSAYVKH